MGAGMAAALALRAAGVKDVFGLMGSGVLELYDALYDFKDMRYIGVRHENCGMHMADAYGRTMQSPGLFIAGQAGPGSANMVLGLAQAKMAYSPVVVLTGLPSTEHLGRDSFQEIDQHTLFLPVTKRVLTVPRAERIPEMIHDAFRIADSGRRGPVVVQIPRDLFNNEVDVDIPRSITSRHNEGGVDATVLRRVADLLKTARAPVIMAGAGIKWGRGTAALVQLAEKLQLPITASAGHGDVAPSEHPLFAGQVGPRGNPVASRLVREADVVLAVGTRLGFNTTFYKYNDLSKDARIVQVDIDPVAVGRYFPVEVGIVGDAGGFCAGLAGIATAPSPLPWAGRNDAFRRERDELLKARDAGGARTSKPLHYQVIYKELREAAPKNALFTLDAGSACLQATDELAYSESPSLITPLDCGMVGFSYAAGLGAKVARPDRTVISLAGDGAFGMTLGEITTAVHCGINSIAVVLDNEAWGSEIAYQRDFFNGRYIGAHCISPRYDEVAKLCGGEGYYVTEKGELADAIRQAMKVDKPVVIHAKVTVDDVISFRKDALKKKGT
jgi:acetolactate synthase-1/2/3 large subunit/sulfoacetaldehyde acetyltransferase